MRTFLRYALFLVALGATPAACSLPGRNPGTKEETIFVNGVTRRFSVHLPPTYGRRSGPVPLLILLHGHGSSGANIERSTGMSYKADDERFIAVYPDGRGKPSAWQVFDDASGHNDDVAFISQLIDTMKKLYSIDDKRIYVAGHSNGGMMAYRVGVDLADEIAGIGVSAGLLGKAFAADNPAATPVTLVAFHGRADNVVPYDGGDGDRRYQRRFLSAPASVAAFAQRDGCDNASVTERANGNVVEKNYSGCGGGSAVLFVTIKDLSHKWPGDRHGLGLFTDRGEVRATDTMWEVFKVHPKL